ncbi:MAG: glutamate--tRNA ligase [Planctomycetes bacterium]|nr:glutamate--tRNA ligase [Planctomycetota bacterium]
MTDSPRVRIAPSPTGNVHLGLARTSLFNWAFARKNGGTFILRIEDTDLERSTKESERQIIEGLKWLGVQWDEGPDVGGPYAPYHQTERVEGHLARAEELLASGNAYRCFCDRERLDALRVEQEQRKETPRYDRACLAIDAAESARRAAAGEAFAIRFRVPEGETTFTDLVRGDMRFDNAEVDDWVMVRQGGNPTYNFVVVCDDADMRITHVLRGEEHLTNTPKQVLLAQALGIEPPHFGHLPLMLGVNRKKLSKRDGADVSLEDYRKKGYPKAAIINFLCLQGWALDGETEIFSLDQFVENFDPQDVSKDGAVFDPVKFQWMAGEYLRQESPKELAEHCAPYVIEAGLMTAEEIRESGEWFRDVVHGHRERIRLYSELPEQIESLFAPDDQVPYEEAAEQGARKHENRVATLEDFLAWLTPQLTKGSRAEQVREGAKQWVKDAGLKFPALFQPLRCALTGKAGGPDLFELMEWLGGERSLVRIQTGIKRLA